MGRSAWSDELSVAPTDKLLTLSSRPSNLSRHTLSGGVADGERKW